MVALPPASLDRVLGLIADTAGMADAAIGHLDRAVAFCATAGYGPERAWAMLPALARAAGEVGDAPADELAGGFRTPGLEGAENVGVAGQLADFRLDELFAALARRDSARALREARGLTDLTTRSLVTVAAARARLAAPGRAELLRRGAK